MPFWRKRSTTSVAVDPTGSNVARTGTVVSIEPMWWWSRISTISASSTPGTLCACSAWSTRIDAAAARVDEVRAGDQADRRAGGVDGDRGAVVDVLDRLGDVGDEVVGADGQRVGVHDGPARRGQRDHAAGDVAVQRRDDDRGAVLARRGRTTASVGATPLEATTSAAPSSIARRCASSRSPTTTTSPAPIPVGERTSIASTHTRPATSASAAEQRLALEDVGDRRDGGRRVDEARGLARLADVAAGQRALGDDADELAVVVDDRDDVGVLARHHQADGAHRVAVARLHEAPSASRRARAA